MLVSGVRRGYLRARRETPEEKGARGLVWEFVKRSGEAIRVFSNFSHRLYVKVNLGQDDLRDVEILRLIASNVYSRYRDFQRRSLGSNVWRVLRATLLFLVVGALYFIDPVFKLNQGFKRDTRIYNYLPSQASFMLQSGSARFFNRPDNLRAEDNLNRREFGERFKEAAVAALAPG